MVGIGQIAKHVGLARKINDYLQSGASDGSPIREHAAKMDSWLSRMLAQLHASQPAQPKVDAPSIEATWEWVEDLVKGALAMVDAEMNLHGAIGWKTAWRVQQALVAALATGCYCPPPRISYIISLIHPSFNSRIPCQDADCAMGLSCEGNRLELVQSSTSLIGDWAHFGYNKTTVRSVCVHHKNDRRQVRGIM
jgi:hypothetical protein